MMPYELDYRYDVRRALPEAEKQKYQWQQVQMTVIADRYPKRQLIDELNEIYVWEKEQLGLATIGKELEHHPIPTHEETENRTGGGDAAVSDV
uniref:Cytoplasmic protein n=1 Tax=Caenorhabditis tropicalis TaxID=1561998 RepID=A0A1I7TF06_9PELO